MIVVIFGVMTVVICGSLAAKRLFRTDYKESLLANDVRSDRNCVCTLFGRENGSLGISLTDQSPNADFFQIMIRYISENSILINSTQITPIENFAKRLLSGFYCWIESN